MLCAASWPSWHDRRCQSIKQPSGLVSPAVPGEVERDCWGSADIEVIHDEVFWTRCPKEGMLSGMQWPFFSGTEPGKSHIGCPFLICKCANLQVHVDEQKENALLCNWILYRCFRVSFSHARGSCSWDSKYLHIYFKDWHKLWNRHLWFLDALKTLGSWATEQQKTMESQNPSLSCH